MARVELFLGAVGLRREAYSQLQPSCSYFGIIGVLLHIPQQLLAAFQCVYLFYSQWVQVFSETIIALFEGTRSVLVQSPKSIP